VNFGEKWCCPQRFHASASTSTCAPKVERTTNVESDELSPFAETLKSVRVQRGLRQEDLARKLECDRSRISALENDQREGVSVEFVEEVSRALNLADEEAQRLLTAMRNSQRAYVVPPEASPKAYMLARELFDRLETMPEPQLDVLRGILNLSAETWLGSGPQHQRVWRKDKRRREDGVP
jgi:transcriptional regulator with XRE-family HTH domain